MKISGLRSVFLLVLTAAALSAQAVTYTFDGFYSPSSATLYEGHFVYNSPDVVTTKRTLLASDFASIRYKYDLANSPELTSFEFAGVDFLPSSTFYTAEPVDVIQFHFTITVDHGTGIPSYGDFYQPFYFAQGDLATFGEHLSTPTWDDARLTVSPVPEPASLAALGLGAVATLRRRGRKPSL